jgi:hypothetical protein
MNNSSIENSNEDNKKSSSRRRRRYVSSEEKLVYYPYMMIFNSTALYLIAHIFVFFVFEFISAFMASEQGIPMKFYYHRIYTDIPFDIWTSGAIAITFLSPPIVCIFLVILAGYGYYLAEHSKYPFRLAFLWLMIVGFNVFYSNLIYTFFSYKGMALMFEWVHAVRLVYIPLMMFGFVANVVLGMFVVNPFLKLSPSKKIDANLAPKKFVVLIMLIPYVIGSLVSMLIYLPYVGLSDILMSVGVGITALSAVAFAKPVKNMKFIKNIKTNSISYTIICLLLVSIIGAIYFSHVGISLTPSDDQVGYTR